MSQSGEVTRNGNGIAFTRNHIMCSIVAVRAAFKDELRLAWNKRWASSKYGQRIAKFDRTPPGNRITLMYRNLSRPQGSILTQLRSGHVGLNRHLARIKAVDSPLCVLCQTQETVEHYLLGCRRFIIPRHHLRVAIGRQTGGAITRHTLLATPKNMPALFDYIDATERFPAYTAES